MITPISPSAASVAANQPAADTSASRHVYDITTTASIRTETMLVMRAMAKSAMAGNVPPTSESSH